MEKKYYIALYLLGITNIELINIMEQIPESQLKNIFQSNLIELQYKYNLSLEKYYKVLSNKEKIEAVLKKADKIIQESKVLNIKIIPYISRYYPKQLKELKDPPALIYLKGKYVTTKDKKSLACIGARQMTNFGAGAVERLVSNLTNERFTIISGLAAGIDTYSHEVCLDNGGRTIAVLAHGLDIIYPSQNKNLAERILNNGGTLISEYPVGTKPEKYRFVNRNRLIAALAKGTIIFEAKSKSGSMHTVKFALELNKKIFCPVPTESNQSVSGLVHLLNNKIATPITCKNDYRKIVKGLNYKLSKNLLQTKKLKNHLIKELSNISDLEYRDVKKDNEKIVNLKLDKEIYEKLKNKIHEDDFSISEYINSLINYSLK